MKTAKAHLLTLYSLQTEEEREEEEYERGILFSTYQRKSPTSKVSEVENLFEDLKKSMPGIEPGTGVSISEHTTPKPPLVPTRVSI